MAVRERTFGSRSVENAMRAVLDAGGNVSALWDIERIVETCDRALGGDEVQAGYARFGLAPGKLDLDELAKRLGVSLDGERVVYDDRAPLAAIRRALTERH